MSRQYKEIYAYDEVGNQLSDLREVWENDEWKYFTRAINTYDEAGNFLTYTSELFSCGEWIPNYDQQVSFEDTYENYFHFDCYKAEVTWKNISSVNNEYPNNSTITTFPNPFTNSTIIEYNLEEHVFVSINIYDHKGNKITTLINQFMDVGEYQEVWNAENYSPGMYYYTIQTGEMIESGKMILVK